MPGRRGKDRLQFSDLRAQLGRLIDDLLALKRSEPAQLHVQDGDRLDLGQGEPLHQLPARGVRRLGVADEVDHLVEMVERDQQALEDVQALAGLAQLVAGPTDDHVDLVVDVEAHHLVQP